MLIIIIVAPFVMLLYCYHYSFIITIVICSMTTITIHPLNGS